MLNAKWYMEMAGILNGRCQNHKVLDATDFYSTQNPQVRTRKPKMENEGKRMKSMLTEDVAKTDQHKTSEMIGFISVSLGCCTAQRQDDDLIEAQEHCSTEQAISKPTKIDSVHCGSQFTVELRRPVSRHEASGPMPVQNCKVDIITGGKDNGRMVPSETCLRSCALGDTEADSHTTPPPPSGQKCSHRRIAVLQQCCKSFSCTEYGYTSIIQSLSAVLVT